MKKNYLVTGKEDDLSYKEAAVFDDPKSLQQIAHPIRMKILRLLADVPMYPSQIAQKLKIHEQKIYYHIKQLCKAGILEVCEKKEIRGTTAKKFRPTHLCFTLDAGGDWKKFSTLLDKEINKDIKKFLEPFVKEHQWNASIVVGSPDAHGPHKARARDGHYAIDLALFVGKFMEMPKDYAVKLDVDVKSEKEEKNNLIVIGGPITNLIMSEINSHLPVRFSDEKPWGLYSEKTGRSYLGDTVGMIARIDNPFCKESKLLVIAGVGNVGTKAAVIALTREHKQLLKTFEGQRRWSCVIQGFDLDGDGKVDSIEVLE